MEFVLDRNIYIAVYVIGYLLRGMIYHFFPWVNEVLMVLTIVWPILIIAQDIRKGRIRPDLFQKILVAFFLAAGISTALNVSSILVNEDLELQESLLSLWQMVTLFFILFSSGNTDQPEEHHRFVSNLSLTAWAVISLLAAGSLVLFVCYRAGISFSGGIGGADHIFTYGHLGEETRFCGLFGYSTDGGNLCALALVLSVFLYETKRVPSAALLFCGVILALTIYFLDVRTSMLEVILVFFILGYRFAATKWSGKTAGILCLLLIILGIAGLMFLKQDQLSQYFSAFREDPYTTLSFLTTGRSKFWLRAIQEFTRHPFFGTGWNNNIGIGFFDNHNLLINILLWTGLAGTVPFLLFLGLLIRKIWSNRRSVCVYRMSGLVILLSAVFFESLLDRAVLGTANTGAETSFFWLAAGILAYLPDDAGKEKR